MKSIDADGRSLNHISPKYPEVVETKTIREPSELDSPTVLQAAEMGTGELLAATRGWPRRKNGSAGGRTKEWLDTGGQHAVKLDRLVPNAQHSTKPG